MLYSQKGFFPALTRMKRIIISEISVTQKDKCCMILFIWNHKKVEVIETDYRMVVKQGLGLREEGEMLVKEYKYQL